MPVTKPFQTVVLATNIGKHALAKRIFEKLVVPKVAITTNMTKPFQTVVLATVIGKHVLAKRITFEELVVPKVVITMNYKHCSFKKQWIPINVTSFYKKCI